MFHLYLYELVGAATSISHKIKTEIVVHHVVMMGLIFGAYCYNLSRFGIMWQVRGTETWEHQLPLSVPHHRKAHTHTPAQVQSNTERST